VVRRRTDRSSAVELAPATAAVAASGAGRHWDAEGQMGIDREEE